MDHTLLPFVSCLICTYNQENYILQAIQSALSQDYPNFEIIISDDCSTDSTWQIINEFYTNYSGSIPITIRRNKTNFGVAKHWDDASRVTNGELIFHFAGDDMSLPHRLSTVVSYWLSLPTKPLLISSNGYKCNLDCKVLSMLIEQNSSDVPFLSSRKHPFIVDVLPTYVVGFSLVISRDYYALFDKLELYMWSEDEIFRSRALLLGTISYIPQPLVYYRDGGISNDIILERRQYLHRVDQQCLSRFNFLFTLMRDMNTHGLLNDFNYLALDYSSNLLSYTLSANFLDSLLRLIPLLWRKGPPKVSKKTLIRYYILKFLLVF